METAKTTVPGSAEGPWASAHFPTATHQSIAGCLLTEISVYLKARETEHRAAAASFAVFFKDSEKICIQPDIVVVQDEDKLDEEGCHGAPDWVIEIVSSASRELDYGQKLGIYIREGVREYWIVDPEKKLIVTYCLEHPDVPAIYRFGDIIKSDIYPDLVIDSSLLDRIQYRKAAETGDRPNEAKDTAGNPVAGEPSCPDLQPANQDCPTGTAEEIPPELITDPAELKTFILRHFPDLAAAKNKAPLLKAAMSALKGRADSKAVNETVTEICK